MDGPRLTRSGKALLVAHTVEGRIGWSELEGARVKAPDRTGAPQGRYPLALRGERGAVCLVWQDGQRWRWVVRAKGADPIEGELPLPAGSRAAGFVDPDGSLVVVG